MPLNGSIVVYDATRKRYKSSDLTLGDFGESGPKLHFYESPDDFTADYEAMVEPSYELLWSIGDLVLQGSGYPEHEQGLFEVTSWGGYGYYTTKYLKASDIHMPYRALADFTALEESFDDQTIQGGDVVVLWDDAGTFMRMQVPLNETGPGGSTLFADYYLNLANGDRVDKPE